jgi:sporulation and spore germination protein
MTKRIFAAMMLCVLASCTSQQVHLVSRNDLPKDLYPEGRRTPDPSHNARVTLYMLDGNRLAPVTRTGKSDMPLPELVLRALLSGPTRAELAKGLATSIPAPVELSAVTVDSGVADVDFNAAFQTSSREELLRRVAQVVYTLSELDDIDSVTFFANGQRMTVIDQNNEPHLDAVARARYSRFAPRNPLGEAEGTAPLRIDLRGEEESAVPR